MANQSISREYPESSHLFKNPSERFIISEIILWLAGYQVFGRGKSHMVSVDESKKGGG